MNVLLTGVLALIALVWVVQSVRGGLGLMRLPRLKDAPPLADVNAPLVSILFSARDEEEKLPRALATLLALDYPRYDVIAINDRSEDATGRILDQAAARDPRLKVIHVAELPPGWLGKPHGLQRGYEASSGDYLVFTDADVRFAPDVLRRALALAGRNQWDHLTLLGQVDLLGFWEKVVVTFFAVGLNFASETWRVSDPTSRSYMGAGAFQMLRRPAYETIGAHTRLRMEVIDDMKLGKLVKQNRLRSGVGIAEEAVAVRWHAGLANLVRGTTKNFFAASGYSLPRVAGQTTGLCLMQLFPLAALFFASGWDFALAAVSVAAAAAVQGSCSHWIRAGWWYGATFPLGVLLLCFMLARSAWITVRQGGVIWRGTFYPLAELRKGMV